MAYLKIVLLAHTDHLKLTLCIFLLGLLFKHKPKNGFEAFIILYIVLSNAFRCLELFFFVLFWFLGFFFVFFPAK